MAGHKKAASLLAAFRMRLKGFFRVNALLPPPWALETKSNSGRGRRSLSGN
nr:L32 [uncultured bacterium]